MTTSPPRALIFDIGNVILRFDFNIALRRLRTHSDELSAELLARLETIKVEYETGRLSREEFQRQIKAAIGYTGPDPDLVSAWEDIFTVNEPMVESIGELRKSYPLYLLSNTSDLHLDYVFRTYPVFSHFTDGVYSFRAGCMKPDPEIYRIAATQFGVDPAEAIFADDLEANIRAAETVGFRSFRYDYTRHEAWLEWLESNGVAVRRGG